MDRRAAKVRCSRTREELRRMENSPMEPWQALESATIDRPASTFETTRASRAFAMHHIQTCIILRHCCGEHWTNECDSSPQRLLESNRARARNMPRRSRACWALPWRSVLRPVSWRCRSRRSSFSPSPGRLDQPDVQPARRLVGRRGPDAGDGISHRSCSWPRSLLLGRVAEGGGASREDFMDVGPRRHDARLRCSCSARSRRSRVFIPRRPWRWRSAPAFN